jgi:hypothetical protein
MQKSSKMPRQVKAHAGVEPADPCVLRRLYPVEQLTLWWVSGTEDMVFMFPLLEVGAYCVVWEVNVNEENKLSSVLGLYMCHAPNNSINDMQIYNIYGW